MIHVLLSLNYVELYAYTSSIAITISTILTRNSNVRGFLSNFINYGKLRNHSGRFEIPKSYFRHFYIVAVITSTTALLSVYKSYFFDSNIPEWLINCVNFFAKNKTELVVPPKNILIGLTLYTIHCYKRFYETHFVNIFSKTAKIILPSYLVAIIYYPFSFMGILSGAPKFTSVQNDHFLKLELNYLDYLIIAVFLLSSWLQYQAALTLANLRKNGTCTKNRDYALPEGGLFNYLSSPHFNTEILIYACLAFYFWNSLTWRSMFLLVLVNQTNAIYETHRWYKMNFKNFPSRRKMFIPIIY